MATFALPTDESAELAGPMSELLDKFIAIKPLARETVNVGTAEYGVSPALRVQIVDLDAGTDAGTRLLFWSAVQRQVLESTRNAEWTIGRISMQPQASDPTRTVYLLHAPDASTIDPAAISQAIDDAVSPF